MSNKLEEIIRRTRGTGNTNWILQSAIDNPNCIIISKNMQQARQLEKTYYSLLKKSPWYKKLLWKFFGRVNPKFVPLDFRFEGTRLPIVFDNGALF